MKYGKRPAKSPGSKSLPVWEEWIEILQQLVEFGLGLVSLPVWEEWIEILPILPKPMFTVMSLPVWEEWIEIPSARWKLCGRRVSSRMGRVD